MKARRAIPYLAGAGALVLSLAGLAGFQAISLAGSAALAEPANPIVGSATDTSDHGIVSAAASPSPTPNCALDATAPPPDDHGQPANFPPSSASQSGARPSAAQIVDYARRIAGMFGGTPAAAPTATVNAREMSFSEFRALSGWPDNPHINASRCLWVLTIHAPIQIKVPPGQAPRTADVYSVAIDAASGTMVSLMTGRDLIH